MSIPTGSSAVERKKERDKKMQMTMDQFRGLSGMGAMTDASYNAVGGNDGQSNIGAGVQSVMPPGSYIDPVTGQFSETAPAPAQPTTTSVFSGYTIYIVVAGVLVALYFYQKHKGRTMFDLSGLAKDFTGGRKKHAHDESED